MLLKKGLRLWVFCVLVVWVLYGGVGFGRDYISIVGSSTVFPYTQAVAEEFALRGDYSSPVVESTGTGGGFKVFCGGVGVRYPDIAGASREMKSQEMLRCRENGVDAVTEIRLGSDGIVVAGSLAGGEMDLSLEALYLALSYELPLGEGGERVKNPHETWKEVGETLEDLGHGTYNFPERQIRVFGPPPTSGTRDAFLELAMVKGCMGLEANEGIEKDDREELCGRFRGDGLYIDSGENDNLIVQRLVGDKEALGIFGYSFLYENPDRIRAMKVRGFLPDLRTIGEGSYPIARPLYLYVKDVHRLLVPGIDDFLEEYLSEEAFSEDGYLVERGLVLPSLSERELLRSRVLGE